MSCVSKFKIVNGGVEACYKRIIDTEDIVTRLGVITPDRVFLRNYPLSNPFAVFNPSIYGDNNQLGICTRSILGHYMYISSVIELKIPWSDVLYGYVNENKYIGHIVIYPSNKYDIWGVEDPRVQFINNDLYITYIGRTTSFFNNIVRKNRTIALTAMYNKETQNWIKKFVYKPINSVSEEVVSIKDAFLHYYGDHYYLFYRLHLTSDTYYIVYSSISRDVFTKETSSLEQIVLENIQCVLPFTSYEYKYGWGTPPLILDDLGKHFIVLLYGVDRENYIYRVFGLEMSIDKDELIVEAITPRYIMEPRELYELIGDKPATIYPTGIVRVDRENILISYGAGDSVIGFGLIDFNTLMSELDRGRIY